MKAVAGGINGDAFIFLSNLEATCGDKTGSLEFRQFKHESFQEDVVVVVSHMGPLKCSILTVGGKCVKKPVKFLYGRPVMGMSISLTFTKTLWFFWYRSISLQVQTRRYFVLWVWRLKQPHWHSFHSMTNTHSRAIFTLTEGCSPSSFFSRTMNFSSSVQSCARI